MKIIDLRGRTARVDRSRQGRTLSAPRVLGRVSLLVVPVVAYALAGRGEDPTGPAGDETLVAESLGAVLPLHVNDRVEKWVRRFRTEGREEFQALLERQGRYEDMIRAKLRDRGMPEELLYMAMMESGLSPWAVSHASAVGVWQFMTPTAQQYGLRVDEWVDERRDPVRATNAALDYLEVLYDRYGSWYLAAAAYNAGPGRVDRVLRRHADGRSGEEALYWEVLDHLPRETREYVPRLVAATLLAQYAEAYGFDTETVEPYRYDRVFVPGGTSLARVARALDVEVRALRILNPHLVRGVTPPDQTYPVRVPPGTSPQVVASLGPGGTRRTD